MIKGLVYMKNLPLPPHIITSYHDPAVVCFGYFGSFTCLFNDSFNNLREGKWKNPEYWNVHIGVDIRVRIYPPYDCRQCKHLITISEEESGQEDGGIACRIRWEEGDSYLCSSIREVEGMLCKDFQLSSYYEKHPKYLLRTHDVCRYYDCKDCPFFGIGCEGVKQ